MKQFFKFAGIFTIALAAVSCNVEDIDNITEEKAGIPFQLYASADAETKTSIDDNMKTTWSENDQINVFHAAAGTTTYVNDGAFTSTEATSNLFDGELQEDLTEGAKYDWYAIYPYTSVITTPGSRESGYVYIGGRSDSHQSQSGNNGTAHLCGKNVPLYGKVLNVEGTDVPQIQMHQLASIVRVKVTNTTDSPLTVTSLSFTGTEDIVGAYMVNISGESPTYPVYNNYVSNTATLDIENGAAINKGDEAASFYIVIKPFTADAGSKITVAVNGYEKEINLTKATSFTAGKIKTINFNYDYIPSDPPVVGTPVYTLSFTKLTTGTNYNSYTAAHSITCNDINWSLFGNQSIGDNIRVGGKTTTATNRTLTSESAMPAIVNKVVIEHDGIGTGKDSQITVNSISLKVSSTTSFADPIETVTLTNPSVTSAGTLEFVPSTSEWPAGSYYQIVLNYQITGSNNCYLTINDVKFFGEEAEPLPKTLASITVSGQKTAFTVGDTFSFDGTVTANYSDNTTSNVTTYATFTGYDMSNTGEQTVTVSYTEDGDTKTTTYNIIVGVQSGELVVGTELFSCDFGSTSCSLSNYSGGNSYKNESSIEYIASNPDIVKITTDTAGNMTSGNLYFNTKTAGAGYTATISGIKTHGASKVKITWAANNAYTTLSVVGSSASGVKSANSSENSAIFVLNSGIDVISVVFTSNGKSNTRVDNVKVEVAE